jgi:dipeptidyl aminopeptidase/acylaminoacyl peptidase
MSIDARSLLRLVMVDDPQVSPDGRRVAWIRSRIAAEQDETLSTLVVQDIGGGDEREVLADGRGIRSPRWSPDGRWLAYLAPHGAATELFVVSVDGGEPRRVTGLQAAIGSFAWSTRGSAIALVVGVHDGPPRPTGAAADVLRVSRLRWKRDGVGLIGDRYDHLAVAPFDPAAAPVSNPRWLVRGRIDVAVPAWSPDDTRLAFVASFGDSWERGRRSGVHVVDLTTPAAAPLEVANFADVRAQEVCWSPDGGTLALGGHDRDEIGHYGAQRLWLVDARGGGRRAITSDADGTLGNAAYTDAGGAGSTGPRWQPAGDAIVCVMSRGASVRLVRVTLAGQVTPLSPPDRVVGGFSMAPDGRSAVLVTHPRDGTADLESVELDGGGPTGLVRITDHGRAVMGGAPARIPRHLRVDDGLGPALDAWVLVPNVPQGELVPVILYCGGGPGGMRSDNLHVEWQVFAAAGYAVVWVNTRGCQGYGDEFCTAILGSWGQEDFTDNLRGLDAALAAYPQLDRERQAIAGGSYGGYQVGWALGHTKRFRAAVADRVVVDKLAAFGMSDIGPLRAFEFGNALPWDDPAPYLRQSPINDLGGASTPTLVVHSAHDHRCTVGQGEALYAALALQGVESRLVRFPNESHGLSRGGRPWHRVRRIQEYLDWFGRHLGPTSS